MTFDAGKIVCALAMIAIAIMGNGAACNKPRPAPPHLQWVDDASDWQTVDVTFWDAGVK